MDVSRKTAEAAKSTSKTDIAGRRVKTKGEPEFAAFVEKQVPERIQEFAEWLTRETGYEVDLRSVYLGSSLRGTFQKSDENQKRISARAAEIEQEKIDRQTAREERAAAKEKRTAERAAHANGEKLAPKTAAPKAPAKTAAKTTARKPAAAKTTTKATPATTRRRPARPAAKDEDF